MEVVALDEFGSAKGENVMMNTTTPKFGPHPTRTFLRLIQRRCRLLLLQLPGLLQTVPRENENLIQFGAAMLENFWFARVSNGVHCSVDKANHIVPAAILSLAI